MSLGDKEGVGQHDTKSSIVSTLQKDKLNLEKKMILP